MQRKKKMNSLNKREKQMEVKDRRRDEKEVLKIKNIKNKTNAKLYNQK